MRRHEGYSLLELTISIGLMLLVTASVFSLMNPAQGSFAVEPELADMQQRLRVAQDTLYHDLVMAGAGSYAGRNAGSLAYFFATILPFRQGLLNGDAPGTFKSGTITLIHVPTTASQTTTSQVMPAQSAELTVNADAGCPVNDASCGFSAGMTVLIYDDSGSYELFTVTDADGPALHLRHNLNDHPKLYDAGTKIVQVVSHTYYLKSDTATDTYQLMRYDGGSNFDLAVADHVVGLTFDYYGDPQPPRLEKPVTDPAGPWTTYGPKPPEPGVTSTTYPPGENCAFEFDVANFRHVQRLGVIGTGGNTLVRLTEAQLTDGPWCPDATNPNRWDADLIRIRKVAVTLRVQSAVAGLRGPAGLLFAHGGTARGGQRYAPDQEIRFQVSPRNLDLGR